MIVVGQDGGFSGLIGSTIGTPQQFNAKISRFGGTFQIAPRFVQGAGAGGSKRVRLGDFSADGTATGSVLVIGTPPNTTFGAPLVFPMQNISGTITLISAMNSASSSPLQFIEFPAVVTIVEIQKAEQEKWPVTFKWMSNGMPSIGWQPYNG